MVGHTFGPYRVLDKLGAGGMGEVYRARDTKLDRDVALKILPESVANDPDRLMRFEREAKTLASLNHPNIAAIYGIEGDSARALVMELVDGDDLSVRIAQGAMLIEDALPIARQIAEALEAAHEAGIIHRDLKPANIKVKDDGTVKVLDFGLAKALSPEHSAPSTAPGAPSTEHSALTVTSPALTQMGMILGTAAYMSPEQARGRPVDRRADIWAFGVVLYEMLTGRRLFGGAGSGQGDTISDTIAAVLRADIDLSTLPASTPPAIRRLLARCLDREVKTRLRDIGEARIALQNPTADVAEMMTTAGAGAVSGKRRWQTASTAVIGAAAIAVSTWVIKSEPTTTANPVMRFDVVAPGQVGELAISPDGLQLAWIAGEVTGDPRLYLRRLDEPRIRVLDTGQGGIDWWSTPAFSPAGDRLVFSSQRSGSASQVSEIRTMSLTGERSELVGTVEAEFVYSIAWGPGTIFVSTQRMIVAIDESGGPPRTVLQGGDGESGAFTELTVLNEGRDLLFVSSRRGESSLWTVPTAGGDRRLVMEGVSHYAVAASGHLIHSGIDRTLFARRLDEDRVEAVGDSAPVFDEVDVGSIYRVSTTGTLVSAARTGAAEFVWVSRASRTVEVIPDVPMVPFLRVLSPSGRYLLLSAPANGTPGDDFWVHDLRDGGRVRISVKPGVSRVKWIPGADAVILTSSEEPTVMRAEAPWLAAPVAIGTVRGSVHDISPDERQVLATVDNRLVLINVDEAGSPTPFEPQATGPALGAFSPDGRWVVYSTGEQGQSDLWMRPYPDVAAGRWRLGPGGAVAFWRADGREVFYYSEDRWVSRTVRVGALGAAPDLGPVVPLDVPAGILLNGVTPDGQRFLGVRVAQAPETSISFFVNFFEELRAKVPVK